MSELSLSDGDKIVFAGNSIYNQKMWAHYMAARFQLFNPSLHLRTIVIGHGGQTVNGYREVSASNRQYYPREVQSLDPTHVFLEFGHNDASDSKATYKANMTALINDFVVGKNNAIPILAGCNPKATGTGTPRIGEFDDANDEIITALGYGACNKLWQQCEAVWTNNANWTAIGGADDTHPGVGGNVALFYKTVTGFGWSTDISQAVIAGNTPSVTSQSHCTISNLAANAYGGVDFDRLDTRLPWAIDEAGRANAVSLYAGFANAQDFTTTVTGLTSGTYDIYIGGAYVASKTHTELAAGWNMSDLTTGPYFDQCQAVLAAIRDVHDVDRVTLAPNPSPREGVELYKSNIGVQYEDNGLRDAALKASVSTALSSIATYEAAVYTAKQPVARTFSLRRQGFGTPTPPAQRARGLKKAGSGGGGAF